MGGHKAWKKRVDRGELAKGSGGAICRHRPHLGRKGKDLVKNRKGNIGDGNPKKKKKKRSGGKEKDDSSAEKQPPRIFNSFLPKNKVFVMLMLGAAVGAVLVVAHAFRNVYHTSKFS